jgi:hypothetical protein
MRRLIAFVVCLFAVGCAAGAPTKSTADSTPNPGAVDVQGPFRLAFEVPRGTWSAGDAIDGVATLALVSGSAVDLGGSGSGFIGFEFSDVGGSHHVEPVWRADCATYRLDPGKPMTSPIKKSGAFTPDQPDAGFVRSFLADPAVHLPSGDWNITAIASFIEGKDCGGQSHTMRATVRVHVTP